MNSDVLTVSEAAAILRVSGMQVRRLIESGRIHATNAGTGREKARWRINRVELDRFLSPPQPQLERGRHLRMTK